MGFAGTRQLSSQDVRSTSTTKQEQYGAVGVTPDGRVYRYVGADSTGLSIGKLAVMPAKVAAHTNVALDSTSPVAVGSASIIVTIATTAITADQYSEGFAVINDGTGKGCAYRIAGHTTITSAGGAVTLFLDEPIKTALATADSKVVLVASPFSGVGHSTTLANAAGVANLAIAASAFGWVQSGGILGVLSDGIITKGYEVVQSTSVAGAVAISAGNAATSQGLGVVPEATVDAKYYPVKLTIDRA